MIISATRSEESFLLSCWTSVTIITVHLATNWRDLRCRMRGILRSRIVLALEEDFANHPISAVGGARCWPTYRPSGSATHPFVEKGNRTVHEIRSHAHPPGKRGAPRHRHLPTFRRPPRLFTSSFFQRKLPPICPHRRKLRLHLS